MEMTVPVSNSKSCTGLGKRGISFENKEKGKNNSLLKVILVDVLFIWKENL